MDPAAGEPKSPANELSMPSIHIEMDKQGNISIKSNMENKMMIKHIVEMSLEIIIRDITQKSSVIYMPDNQGMPIRRS